MRRYLLTATAAALVAAVAHPGAAWLPSPRAQDTAVFSARSELVVLHVTVKDDHGADVPGLTASSFTVFEDRRPRTIEFFETQDAPADIGLVIDSSRSMLASLDKVIAAAGAFVETSNPEDEIFGLAFNEYVRPVLPRSAPFTSDPAILRTALTTTIAAEGRTALYDAIVAGIDYVAGGGFPRKALVVIADGGDNESVATFEQALRRTQTSNTVIYTVALPDPADREAHPGRLKRLARASGGEAFEPRDIAQISGVMRAIVNDIRHTYTIGFVPGATGDGRLRAIRVKATGRDGRALSVRTRQGYVPDE